MTIIKLNNSFNSKVNGLYAYRFWFYNKCFTLICDKPFVRGDIAEITQVNNNCASVVLLKDTDTLNKEITDTSTIPSLVFFMTKTPVRKTSNYIPVSGITNNHLMFKDTSVIDDNKWHAYGLLVASSSTFTIKDTISKTEMDFIISTSNK